MLYRNPKDGQDMILIPAGPATFGSGDDDPAAREDEKPQFTADLPAYYLGIHCVTNAQYAAFLNASPRGRDEVDRWMLLDSDCHVTRDGSGRYSVDAPGYADHPVLQVSWYGAEAYRTWAGLRLPSELEWEKGARGPEGLIYPWGSQWNPDICRNSVGQSAPGTCPAGAYPEGASPWGLLNMSGNVWEWSADWHEGEAYRGYAAGDMASPPEGAARVLRGRSWIISDPAWFRSASRYVALPDLRDLNLGFRCARGPTG